MATKFDESFEVSHATQVADMPPLDVVTEGIPAQEHDEVSLAVPSEPMRVRRDRRARMFAWALAGVLGLFLVAAGIFGLAQQSTTGTTDLHMGLTAQAWQEFRAGERASGVPGHMGLSAQAWQDYRAGERAA